MEFIVFSVWISHAYEARSIYHPSLFMVIGCLRQALALGVIVIVDFKCFATKPNIFLRSLVSVTSNETSMYPPFFAEAIFSAFFALAGPLPPAILLIV